ncbi:MAG: hypothetical protein ACRCX2_34320 [Paraclostridium sp.]
MKIMCIGDVHIGAIDPINFVENELPWIKTQIEVVRPDMVCLLGDETDSAELKVKSETYEILTLFLKEIYKQCEKYGIYLRVIHGTQSHCGKNVETVLSTLDNKVKLDGFKPLMQFHKDKHIENIKGFNFMFLPEKMYTDYETFLDDIDVSQRLDVVFTHNLIDKALPVVKQVDSQYGLGRSIVIEYSDISSMTNLIIASHVHSDFSYEKLHYTNTLTSLTHTSESNSVPGYLLVDITAQDVSRVENPWAHKYTTIKLDEEFIRSNTLEDITTHVSDSILKLTRKYRTLESNIRVHLTTDSDIHNINKCTYIKKLFTKTSFKLTVLNSDNILFEESMFSNMDVESIILGYLEKNNRVMDKTRLREICGIE